MGLGLNTSHDIVKAHGGELKVETKEGEGLEEPILLNINKLIGLKMNAIQVSKFDILKNKA
jgi:signal transduction histidine kinase